MNERTAAYTLIEIIVAITVLAIIGGVLAFILINGHDQMIYAVELRRALTLAELYLTEAISTGRWDELSYRLPNRGGPIPLSHATITAEEADRQVYDDCDDYNGFSASGIHTLKNGRGLGNAYQPYTVRISVDYVEYGRIQATQTPTDIKRITVHVTWRNRHTVELSTVLTNS
ncbi:MAG: type II secretion system protein [Candidatus Omnitrophota bacterium]|nr:MAG: type II secretion system protein [Candidatus Omnitrophota bacterium]